MYSHTGCFLQLQIKSLLISASGINSTLDSFHKCSRLFWRCPFLLADVDTPSIHSSVCSYSMLDVVMKPHGKIAKQGMFLLSTAVRLQ